MLIHCVRHGESVFNAVGRIQGQADIPLSDLGRRQGAALAKRLTDRPIEAIFASPLSRAMETAAFVAEVFRMEVLRDDRLMEINAGIFQELDWNEIRTRYPEESRRWKAHDPDFVIPKGESRRQLSHRARIVFEEIRSQPFQEVAVVAHGGLLVAALKSLLGIPIEKSPFSLYNASISQLQWDDEPKLITLNEIGHLSEIDCDRPPHRGDL
jgi:probable phosphoglycerate mutase